MQSNWLRYAMLSMLLTLGGCVAANAIVDPYTRLRIEPLANINPDANDRPSPTVLKVYELSSENTFQNSDFFSLFDEAALTLEDDLIATDEFVVRPGKLYLHEMRLNGKTRYVGIVAAFQDIQNAKWRLVVEASPRGYDTVTVEIDRLTLKQIGY